jgi:hypothetical protein
VPNAAVTVTNTTTNTHVKVLSNATGNFSVAGLGEGMYRLDVEAAGFKTATAQGINLTEASIVTADVCLEKGVSTDVVKFTATAPAVQADNGMIYLALNERQVKELPVIDRNYQQLLNLQTGITPPQPEFSVPVDPQRNRIFSTNGQAAGANYFLADGLANTEPFTGIAIRIQPEENIHQVHTATSNYTVDRGFAAGAIVNTVTMAGTNLLHGSLFEFNSNAAFQSTSWFNAGNNPGNRLVYNQFGATVGGPIVKDRTFFFASYEGTYDRASQTSVSTVPTQAVLGGNFSSIPGLALYDPTTGTSSGTGRSAFGGNIIPAARINSTAATIASFLPAPNLPGLVDNYVTNTPLQNDMQRLDGRIDQHWGPNRSLFLRYGYTNARGLDVSPLGNVVGGSTRGRIVGQNAAIAYTHVFNPNVITEARFAYNRYTQGLNSAADQTALGNALGISGYNDQLFAIDIPGLPAMGSPTVTRQFGVDDQFNWAWTWSWRTGRHDLKFGVDIRRNRTDGFQNPFFMGGNGAAFFGPGVTMLNGGPGVSTNGLFYNSFAAFLLGQPTQVGITQNIVTPTIRQSQFAGWIGDSINWNKFTFEFGLRYEFYGALSPSRTGGATFYDPVTNTFNFSGINAFTASAYNNNTTNFAPRFGYAYRFNSRTVLRGGYGIAYFQNPYSQTGLMPVINGATYGRNGSFTPAPSPIPFGPTLTPLIPTPGAIVNGTSPVNLPVTFIARDYDTPYVQSYSTQLQRDFYWGTVLSVGYVGNVGRHIPSFQEINFALPGNGISGLTLAPLGRTASTLLYKSALTNNFNSLQVSLNKRFSKGLAFTSAYTYGNALGYTAANGQLLEPQNLHSNYGALPYDRRHTLSISHLWEIPLGRNASGVMHYLLGGWQLNGIFSWQTGLPLTVFADPITCNCPGSVALPSLNGTVSPYANTGRPFFLNPAAFSLTPGALTGNLSRAALVMPPNWTNYNVSLFKSFRIYERFNLELRGEGYNIGSNPNFAIPVTNLQSANFGRSLAYQPGSGPRQFNVAARILF